MKKYLSIIIAAMLCAANVAIAQDAPPPVWSVVKDQNVTICGEVLTASQFARKLKRIVANSPESVKKIDEGAVTYALPFDISDKGTGNNISSNIVIMKMPIYCPMVGDSLGNLVLIQYGKIKGNCVSIVLDNKSNIYFSTLMLEESIGDLFTNKEVLVIETAGGIEGVRGATDDYFLRTSEAVMCKTK
jgi:hypothetical protein